jgi:cytidine deaminase
VSDGTADGGLLDAARAAKERAYAPYSEFRVGAALESTDGRIFTGCNVENASYPVTICAERVALGTAVASGALSFERLAIATDAAAPTPPCGMCRQALSEFGLDLEIESVAGDGTCRRWRLRDLLPAHFELQARREETGRSGGAGG